MKNLLFFLCFLIFSIQATLLRNGFNADQKRIEVVWKGLQKNNHYPLLLCTAMDCKNGIITNHVSCWNLDKQIIAEWAALNIIKNGILDAETQEIIIISYFGNNKQEWGIEAPKKIALATPTYPVASWVENIPGYSLFANIKRMKTLHNHIK